MSRRRAPSELAEYFAKKGSRQRADEPTDNYSDDEASQDTIEAKRENKIATQLAAARADTLRKKAMADRELSAQSPGSSVRVDRDNQRNIMGMIPMSNPTTFSQRTIDASRNLDRMTETSAIQRVENVRGAGGLDQTVHQTYITYNIVKLMEHWKRSSEYTYYLAVGIFFLVIGGGIIYTIGKQLSTYSY